MALLFAGSGAGWLERKCKNQAPIIELIYIEDNAMICVTGKNIGDIDIGFYNIESF